MLRTPVGCILITLASLMPLPSFASDWNSCADELDRLRRASRDATDAANEVKSKADELENCKQYPDMYDDHGDGCSSKASDYRSALGTLKSELDTVNRRIKSVSSYCGVNLSTLGESSTQR